jgi:hypothetical protein
MRTWGTASKIVYGELDGRLQLVMTRVRNEVADIALLQGFRGEDHQNTMFDEGNSQLRFPDGKHNVRPSKAVDFQPHPRPDKETMLWGALGYIAGAAIQIAKEEGIILRWGGDWNQDGDMANQKFYDLWHLEIVECDE